MADPRLTKLRILYERAKREADAIEKQLDNARGRKTNAYSAYCDLAEELGICVKCGKNSESLCYARCPECAAREGPLLASIARGLVQVTNG